MRGVIKVHVKSRCSPSLSLFGYSNIYKGLPSLKKWARPNHSLSQLGMSNTLISLDAVKTVDFALSLDQYKHVNPIKTKQFYNQAHHISFFFPRK